VPHLRELSCCAEGDLVVASEKVTHTSVAHGLCLSSRTSNSAALAGQAWQEHDSTEEGSRWWRRCCADPMILHTCSETGMQATTATTLLVLWSIKGALRAAD
jgi:hypothetical protein